jgi:hypothetical protein
MQRIRKAMMDLLEADNPQTVRQVFYALVVRGLIRKTEVEYGQTIIRLLTSMRISGEIPWDYIIDETRRLRETETFDSVADALDSTARFYRRSALRECDNYIEIWCEKEALTGLIWDVASDYDVPVLPSKGMASLSAIHETVKTIERAWDAGKSTTIYQFGDHDPSGVVIPSSMQRRFAQLCGARNVPAPQVVRVALTTQQIAQFNLPTRPTKREGNPHAKGFEGESTELDALPVAELRRLVRKCIERHIDPGALAVLREAEASEREILEGIADRMRADADHLYRRTNERRRDDENTMDVPRSNDQDGQV